MSETRAWPGLIEAFRDRLPVTEQTPVVTLLEGNTPLVDAPRVAARAGVGSVRLKVEARTRPDRSRTAA
jgi:Threonine synthase